jgi:hypothetical protein
MVTLWITPAPNQAVRIRVNYVPYCGILEAEFQIEKGGKVYYLRSRREVEPFIV